MTKIKAADVRVVENKTQTRSRPSQRSGVRWSQYYAKTRIHFFLKGETILQNLQERRNRPVALYREKLLELFPEYKGRVRWSQKAGCSCGCSPAFILDKSEFVEFETHSRPIDRYITLEM